MSGLSESEAANLKGLESLMEEFFSPGVSNQRKAQIQSLLEEFEQQVRRGLPKTRFIFRYHFRNSLSFSINISQIGLDWFKGHWTKAKVILSQ